MNDSIISKESIRARARRDFAAGRGRNEHGMNWHALAIPAWQEEWDRMNKFHEALDALREMQEGTYVSPTHAETASPQSHVARAAVSRIDVRQAGV